MPPDLNVVKNILDLDLYSEILGLKRHSSFQGKTKVNEEISEIDFGYDITSGNSNNKPFEKPKVVKYVEDEIENVSD